MPFQISWVISTVVGTNHPQYFIVHREDSRVHACIVCASISCPNVRREAFRPEKIGDQMDSQVRDMLQNTKKGIYNIDCNVRDIDTHSESNLQYYAKAYTCIYTQTLKCSNMGNRNEKTVQTQNQFLEGDGY